jgi:uncharacterized protein
MAPFSPTDKAPGVYIEEVPVAGPIAGVGTSTVAFIGPAEKGRTNEPKLLTNWTEFQNVFGGYMYDNTTYLPKSYVAHAVRGFLDNGGSSFYFVRVSQASRAGRTLNDCHTPTSPTLVVKAKLEGAQENNIQVSVEHKVIASTQATSDAAQGACEIQVQGVEFIEKNTTIQISQDAGENPATDPAKTEIQQVDRVDPFNKKITLKGRLTNRYTSGNTSRPVKIEILGFKLEINKPGNDPEIFDFLSMDVHHSRYFKKIINSQFVDITLADPHRSTPLFNNRPAPIAAAQLNTPAQDENIDLLSIADYRTALESLKQIDDINLLCIPDCKDVAVKREMIDHCANKNRFAILDSVLDQDPNLEDLNSRDGYAARYYPWIEIANPHPNPTDLNPKTIKVPPSGHIAGVYARTDSTRGVFKAPANEEIRGVLGLEKRLTDNEQVPLNNKGINVLRSFPRRGIVVWGARTIAPPDSTWRYINVRRLLLFIEESIKEGTRFAVFEPNNLALWQKVKRQVTDFLTQLWKDGALFGATPDEAFRVRVDEELNPPGQRALGILTIEVTLYPVTPAEYVVFRVIQQPGGPTVQE